MSEIDTNHMWWSRLRHQGMLLSPVVMLERFPEAPQPPPFPKPQKLRDAYTKFLARLEDIGLEDDRDENAVLAWVDTLLDGYIGHEGRLGKKNSIPEKLTAVVRIGSRSETIRPHRVIFADAACTIPAVLVMADPSPHVGRGRGRSTYARFLELLRGTGHRLGLLTNGQQFRLIYAGLDFESWCEWESERWFDDGEGTEELAGLRQLLSPDSLKPVREKVSGLLDAVEESRKRQADLSSVLRENVRQAVELLLEEVSAKNRTDSRIFELLYTKSSSEKLTDAEAHEALMQAAVRIVMRMVVCLFAESRRLLPVNDPIYAQSYGVRTLYELLDEAVRNEGGLHTLLNRQTAWPRVMALFRLVHGGSLHGSFPLRAYGGALFRPGKAGDADPVSRALDILERHVVVSDATIFAVLRKLLRGPLPVIRGRAKTFVEGPVDYTDLRTEFIGLIYEGLLDYRIKRTDEQSGPQVFLNLGREPVLPLARLEEMLSNDPKGLKDLLTTLRKEKVMASVSSDEEEEEEKDEDVDGQQEQDESAEPVVESSASDEELRSRSAQDAYSDAIAWAKKAVILASLVRKQKKREPDSEYEKEIESEARKLINRVVSVGEFYLVRAGNTRKGTGTFYTRPQLAVPTVHRTLEPLCYDKQSDGTLIPKKPDVILGLKVCDPACGSASFLVAALHYLTEALYRSLCQHCELDDPAHSTKVTLPFGKPRTGKPGEEYVPFPPNDPQHGDRFAERVKALLRRHIVERCIYGVDINPLAVELARVSLWVETLDPDLPFSFLDHKIKVGNALVGCWLDRVLDYPLKAWDREGGDGKDGPGTDRIDAMLKGPKEDNGRRSGDGIIKKEMRQLIETHFNSQPRLFADKSATVEQVVAATRAIYSLIHEFSAANVEEREQAYRDQIQNSRPLTNLKHALDEWCALWFWPTDEESLRHAPTPLTFHRSTPERDEIVTNIAKQMRFFHWELEFPDVFSSGEGGFHAIAGNPPWENAQPNPQEFFSEFDPLFRTYGRLESLRVMRALQEDNPHVATLWTEYRSGFKSFANWVASIATPFGDDSATSILGRGTGPLQKEWQKARKQRCVDPVERPFRFQVGRIFTYKLFLEYFWHLLAPTGRLGVIIPTNLYSDLWSRPLRTQFLASGQIDMIYAFQNEKRVFEAAHHAQKQAVLFVTKGGSTAHFLTRFRLGVGDSPHAWEIPADLLTSDQLCLRWTPESLCELSPQSVTIAEIRTQRDLDICRGLYQRMSRLGERDNGWNISYSIELMMNSDAKDFPPLDRWHSQEYEPDDLGRWQNTSGDVAIPLYEGRMIDQFDPSASGWVSGKGRTAIWRDILPPCKPIEPQFLMAEQRYSRHPKKVPGPKVAVMDVTAATNTRTTVCTYLNRVPCGHSIGLLSLASRRISDTLLLTGLMNSMAFDYAVRARHSGLHMSWFIMSECPIPPMESMLPIVRERIACSAGCLSLIHRAFAPEWMWMQHHFPLFQSRPWKEWWSVTAEDRLRRRVELEALAAHSFGLDGDDYEWIVRDDPKDSKSFYRVDRQLPFRERLTGLAAAAFRALLAGTWSAETAADTSNSDFFRIIGIPEMTNEKAAAAAKLAEPLIRMRPGCRDWAPANLGVNDPCHGNTWDDCRRDAVALLGSDAALEVFIEDGVAIPDDVVPLHGDPRTNKSVGVRRRKSVSNQRELFE